MIRRLVLLLVLAGCKSSDSSLAPPPSHVQTQIQVSDDPHDFTRGNQFSLLGTISLYVRVQVPSMPETTMLTVELIDPQGQLFHQEHVPFTRLDQPTMVTDPLFHQPMQAWRADRLDGGWALVRGIPIRGTNFTRFPRGDGAWMVQTRMDGVPGQLSTPVIFQP
jgi:hypothetical protein